MLTWWELCEHARITGSNRRQTEAELGRMLISPLTSPPDRTHEAGGDMPGPYTLSEGGGPLKREACPQVTSIKRRAMKSRGLTPEALKQTSTQPAGFAELCHHGQRTGRRKIGIPPVPDSKNDKTNKTSQHLLPWGLGRSQLRCKDQRSHLRVWWSGDAQQQLQGGAPR